MDQRSTKDKDDVDLESGLPLIGNDSKKVSAAPPNSAKQGKQFFTKISGGFVGGSFKGEDGATLYCNGSNVSDVPLDVLKVKNKPTAQDLPKCAEQVKEKRKKASNKKAPKPPRPPQAPSLDAADHKLIREITELAMLKRARVERMKALKKMKTAKSSSSSSNSNSSILAMVFTAIFFIVIILQGMSSGKTSVASFQGSPVSAGRSEGDLISIQYKLNPHTSDSNAPGSESHHFVQQVAGSDLPEKLKRNSG
ncbi:hypothetical protein VNO77_23757 [Canavalia gladiata]|uniref:Transmembrane protein n=1 Tax=Canavalia gladiata TaxID=3824 RepID=A0AAN9L7G8_CANGL